MASDFGVRDVRDARDAREERGFLEAASRVGRIASSTAGGGGGTAFEGSLGRVPSLGTEAAREETAAGTRFVRQR